MQPMAGVASLLNNDVLRECLEPHAALLLHGDRHVAGLARVDVPHGAALACMRSADDGGRPERFVSPKTTG